MITTPGFYVRSLAHDLGSALGCGAYLESLRRTRAGAFDLASAVALETVEQDPEGTLSRLVPLENLVPELPAVRVNARGAIRVAHGNFLDPSDFVEKGSGPVVGAGDGQIRVFDEGGRLLALARTGPDGLLRPVVVLV
jgi:tRNA pseudouridine55 synthase